MSKAIFWVIFGLSSIGYATGCSCPDMENLKVRRTGVPCPCPSGFLDVTTDRCVRYFDCPFFDFLDESNTENNEAWVTGLGLDEEITGYVRKVFAGTNSGRRRLYDVATSEFPLQALLDAVGLDYNETAVRSSPDASLIDEVFGEELEASFESYSGTYSSLFNPFVMSNRAINRRCRGERGCVWYDVFERNSLRIEREMGRFFGNVTSRGVVMLEKVARRTPSFCAKHECLFLPDLMEYRDFLEELLDNCRMNRDDIVRNVMRRIRNSREDNIKRINAYVGRQFQ